MRFQITHRTQYEYRAPASESFAELRVWPRDTATQKILRRQLTLDPSAPVDHYVDYFGNHVEFFSLPFRHNRLSVESTAEVITSPPPDVSGALSVTVGEAWQIFNSQMFRLFDFLQPTEAVPLGDVLLPINHRFFEAGASLGEALLGLNTWIYKNFAYQPGATEISTPISQVIKQRSGVCQDFAHLMLALLRSSHIPARYVSGYIEAYDPEKSDGKLVGAAASHAWVEVCLPGGAWWGLDPTNNQTSGERHVVVAVGRDYGDVAPMRGTYKGAHDQKLEVIVSVKRRKSTSRSPLPTSPA